VRHDAKPAYSLGNPDFRHVSFTECSRFCHAASRALSIAPHKTALAALMYANSPHKKAAAYKNCRGGTHAADVPAGKRYHFFRHLSEKGTKQKASGA
jgi:hypothetical protein